ncbi:MAG: hypothetical protein AUJ85_09160 [Elusimicrobia bacterium CG1_02_37_114]|nr:MAG: hypothetical protein AUJ85_09160 [Elusimicrobia bacterium CG1_02_37_114]PIV53463.1 MAG: hypothetical protein COS17_03780 [Elusimicrobia bacterium CG02_land_8_20_14_3_00_37_13]PIZ12748.1 MAG: hypothetical protein COY53_08425 [Elusimicrobia bacterium CG_4_10_14_0_8_um_filter_37_32]
MTDKDFFEKLSVLSTEFAKYILEYPEIDEQIPDGAQVVLLLENETEFNERNIALAREQREEGQPVVFVKVKGLASVPISRIINPELKLVSSI